MKQRIVIILGLFTLILNLSSLKANEGKGGIKGEVRDKSGPIAYIQIGIPVLGIGTLSDENGQFLITDIPAGIHVLELRFMGYKTVYDTIDVKANQIQTQKYTLVEDEYELQEVVIVDQQTGLTSRTPYNLTSLSANNIEYKGNPSGLMGFIREEPGVYGAELGQGIVKPFIRGLGFSRVVTIYQGNKLESHQWGADHGLGVNDLGVGQVDIIKGPASILYGSGAIGGVIMIKDDESYLDKRGLTGNIGTTFNSLSGGIRPHFSLGTSFKSGFFIATDAAYESHADYINGDNRTIGNSRFNTQSVRFHTGINRVKFKNKLSYTYHRQELGIITDDEMIDSLSMATTRFDRKKQLPFQLVSDHIISYRQTTIHKNVVTALNISHQINSRQEIENDFQEIDLGLKQSNTFYNFRLTHTAKNKLESTFGVQGAFVHNRNYKEAGEILLPDARTWENGLYYMAGLSLGKYFLQAGIRYDYRSVTADASTEQLINYGFILPGNPSDNKLNKTFSGFTGSLGASRFWDKHTLKLNLSTGYRAPDLAELFSNGSHPGTNRFEKGNASFGREQSYQGDLNWIFTHPKFSSQVSVFSNVVQNYLYFTQTNEVTPEGLEIWSFLQADAILYGAELGFTYQALQKQRLQVSWNANFVRGKKIQESENLTFIPADNFTWRLQSKPFHNQTTTLQTNVKWVTSQNRPGLNESSTPGYALWNMGADHTFNLGKQKLALGISVFNLLGNTFVDHMSILRAFDVSAGGRNFMLNVQYRF